MKMMDKMKTIIAAILTSLPFSSQAQSLGLTCWTIEGGQTKLAVENSFMEVPDSIAAIDLCGIEDIALDCSSANPNCLYYIDKATSVEGLPSANVVCEGICDGLLLTDEACFFCPMSFWATDAMLRFTPRLDDEDGEPDFNQPSHETVLLPFDADFVIPQDVNGPMPERWLQLATYSTCDFDMLVFYRSYDDCLMANTPYLVTFEYGAFGSQILFCGQNKYVEETRNNVYDNVPYCFAGVTKLEKEQSGFYRYYRGQESYFIHSGDGQPMEPFRCFIVSTMTDSAPLSSGQILWYYVSDGSDSIGPCVKSHASMVCYDMMGRPLPKGSWRKGIIIADGVKILR